MQAPTLIELELAFADFVSLTLSGASPLGEANLAAKEAALEELTLLSWRAFRHGDAELDLAGRYFVGLAHRAMAQQVADLPLPAHLDDEAFERWARQEQGALLDYHEGAALDVFTAVYELGAAQGIGSAWAEGALAHMQDLAPGAF